MILDDIIVRSITLPLKIKGVTITSPDGYYNIYINDRYPVEMMNKILKHELSHVTNYDFDNFDDIKFIEKRASGV